jgi:hypothetical protein
VKSLSDARIEHLAIGIVRALGARAGLDVVDQGRAVQVAAAKLRVVFRANDGLDTAVRARIASLSRKVPEGSREWDVLYKQYSEELARHRR